MRNILAHLILEEIKTTALIRSLQDLEIDATVYLPETSRVIFELANVTITEELSDQYFTMIESNQTNKEEWTKLSEEIASFLLRNQKNTEFGLERKAVSQ